MRNVVIKHFAKVEHLGFAVHKRDRDNAESVLKLSVLIQIVQHNVCIDILLSSITMRIPARELSSRRSEMPSTRFS